jgi:hypothetical protein
MYRFLILVLLLQFSKVDGQTLNELIVRECEKVRPIESADTVYFAIFIMVENYQELNLRDTCFISSNVSRWVGDTSLRAPCVVKYSMDRFNFSDDFRGKKKETVFTLAGFNLEEDNELKSIYHLYWRKYTVKQIRRVMKKGIFGFYTNYKSVIEIQKESPVIKIK